MARVQLSGPQLLKDETELPAACIRRDIITNALEELFYIEHPEIPKPAPREIIDAFTLEHRAESLWAYLPWRNLALQIPNEDAYFRLRTGRNRALIADQEQVAFREAPIAIAGLSVGSAALESIVRSGGSKKLRIADPDTIEITNLNRMQAVLPNAGDKKVEVAARRTWEIDPFAQIDGWGAVEAGEEDEFVAGMRVVIDEIDNIRMKISLREAAKRAGIPVVMGTDNGEGVILDVERFDLEPDRPILHGRFKLTGVPEATTREEFASLASRIIDPSLFTERQRAAVEAIGKTAPSISQLGTAATVSGVAVAYAVRMIASGQTLPSGRYVISPERALTQPIA